MRKLIHSVAYIDEQGNTIERGHVIINDERIEHIASGDAVEGAQGFAEVIDGAGHLLLPGLVNAHGHAAMSLLRGFADDLPLQTWLSELIWPAEDLLTPEDIAVGTNLAMLEMMETGTTTFTDMYFAMDRVAEAVIAAGMRGVLGRGMVAPGGKAEATLAESRAFIRDYHLAGEGRIHTTWAPHAPYTCSADFLKKVIAEAEALNAPIQIHVSETKREVDDSYEQYGVSPVQWLSDLGLFDLPTIAAHCVHVDEGDIALMRTKNVHVAHNPGSNLKLGSGVAPLVALLDAGVRVGVGTDGASSNNKLDMMEELRLVAMLHKGVNRSATAIDALTALRLVTSASAQALFLEPGLGTLQKGAPADLILVETTGPRYFPRHNLLSHLVYSSHAGDVTDVFVAGKQLYKNRQHVTIDKERILADAERVRAKFQPVKDRYRLK